MNCACDRGCCIWLCQKATAFGQIALCNFCMTGCRNDLDRWPTIFHEMGELESVHRTRHIDVGKDQANVASLLKDRNGVVRIFCFDHFKTVSLNHLDRIHADQDFVFHNKHNRSLASSQAASGSTILAWRPDYGGGNRANSRVPDTTARGEHGFRRWFRRFKENLVSEDREVPHSAAQFDRNNRKQPHGGCRCPEWRCDPCRFE